MVIVVFRSRLRSDADLAALEVIGARMYELGSAMPGFVSYKDFAADDGETLTLVEFETEEQLLAWRNHPEHVETQARDSSLTLIAKVSRDRLLRPRRVLQPILARNPGG